MIILSLSITMLVTSAQIKQSQSVNQAYFFWKFTFSSFLCFLKIFLTDTISLEAWHQSWDATLLSLKLGLLILQKHKKGQYQCNIKMIYLSRSFLVCFGVNKWNVWKTHKNFSIHLNLSSSNPTQPSTSIRLPHGWFQVLHLILLLLPPGSLFPQLFVTPFLICSTLSTALLYL